MDLGADFQDYRDLQLPLCILQLDPADRAVLRIAGKSVVNESSVCSIVQAFILSHHASQWKNMNRIFFATCRLVFTSMKLELINLQPFSV